MDVERLVMVRVVSCDSCMRRGLGLMIVIVYDYGVCNLPGFVGVYCGKGGLWVWISG